MAGPPGRLDNRTVNRASVGLRALLILVLVALAVPAISGCGANEAHDGGWTTQPGQGAGDSMSTAMQAAWAGRPSYVDTSTRTQEAYAFAMAHPDVLQWMPCYCGCGAMGHRSNLDCFFEPTGGAERLTFEEHASYCQICVDEALLAKQLTAQGQSLRAVRGAVDRAFGGAAPGTPTELPPA
jgi:uncharacterized protein YceK